MRLYYSHITRCDAQRKKDRKRYYYVIRIVSFEFYWFSTFLKDKSNNIQTNDNIDFPNLPAYLGAKVQIMDAN